MCYFILVALDDRYKEPLSTKQLKVGKGQKQDVHFINNGPASNVVVVGKNQRVLLFLKKNSPLSDSSSRVTNIVITYMYTSWDILYRTHYHEILLLPWACGASCRKIKEKWDWQNIGNSINTISIYKRTGHWDICNYEFFYRSWAETGHL